ncbi:MAG: VanZ family protein [Planctomycetota bacterium]
MVSEGRTAPAADGPGPPPPGHLGPLGDALVACGLVLSAIPRLLAWLPPVALGAVIFHLSSSELDIDAIGSSTLGHYVANLGHPGAFGILALLVAAALAPRARTLRGPWALLTPERGLWAVVLTTLYGLTDELHQATVPGRDASLLDLLGDFVGALFAVLVVLAVGNPRTTRAALRRLLLVGLVLSFASAGVATWWDEARGTGPWPF